MDRAAEELADVHAFDTEITVLETTCCALGDFGTDAAPSVPDDLIAGVMRAFRGRLSGAALLSMEPEEALSWTIADGDGQSPIETYVDLGGRLVEAVIRAAAESLEVEVDLGEPRLEESSVGGCLLRTHAPSDTVLVASRLEIRAARQHLRGQLHLIMEPKVVGALLGALAVALH